MFTITVTESTDQTSTGIQRYTQTVDALDLNALIKAVNTAPRKPRYDKGSKKAPATPLGI